MKIDRLKKLPEYLDILRIFAVIFFISSTSLISRAQSTDQNSPTPVGTNEIRGKISARDIGDARLTNYFYTFNAGQGDVFINIVTRNLDGDIDLFTFDGLRPLTKIRTFADVSDSETGRVVYLRKFEKLLLRIQGRTPTDEPATYIIKFAGSFIPLENIAENPDTGQQPAVPRSNRGEVPVNSVGTIITPVPKPPERPVEVDVPDTVEKPLENELPAKEINVTSVDAPTSAETSATIEIKREAPAEDPKVVEDSGRTEPAVEITDKTIPENVPGVGETAEKTEAPKPPAEKEPTEKIAENPNPAEAATPPPAPAELSPVDPKKLVDIQLVITFKDGRTIKLPLNKVFSFNINQGILRIVLSDGNISKYSMLEIEQVTVSENPN